MDDKTVIKQRNWTEEELVARGFRYYERRKLIVMARELPEEEAPKTIKTPWDTLIVEAGAMIVYEPPFQARKNIDEYEHWPVRRDLFDKTYASWDERDRPPTPGEAHLVGEGCAPYYKTAGAWAKLLTTGMYMLSLESPEPVHIPAGEWLCIGLAGEPWSQSEEDFRARYIVRDDPAVSGAGR